MFHRSLRSVCAFCYWWNVTCYIVLSFRKVLAFFCYHFFIFREFFSHSLRIGLLSVNALPFLHLRMSLFPFYSRGIVLPDARFKAESSFLSALEKCCAASLLPPWFQIRNSLLFKLKVKVAQTFCDPMDYTVHGILQARILEWIAFPFSRGSANPRIEPRSPTLQADSLPAEPQGKPKKTGVGSLAPPGDLPDAGWHHRLDGHEFEYTTGVCDGQGGLACCDSWGRKESDTTEWLNWTELNWKLIIAAF